MSKVTQHTRTQNRNYRLVARFYFYSTIIGLKFSRVMQHLEEEFEISEGRICDLISEHSDLVNHFEYKQIKVSQLKERYPFMSWNYVPAKMLKTTTQQSLSLF